MIDFQKDIQEHRQSFISLRELITILHAYQPEASLTEIATWLQIKLQEQDAPGWMTYNRKYGLYRVTAKESVLADEALDDVVCCNDFSSIPF